MLGRLLRADLRRSAVVSTVLALLIAVAAALTATSAALMTRTFVAIDQFWGDARPPDTVQMHGGDLDTDAVAAWVKGGPEITDHHLIRTLPVRGANLWFNGVNQSESLLEPAFVTSPERFDLLLDLDGRRVQPRPGEIYMPVHYLAEKSIAEGETVKVTLGKFTREFTVVGFARDAQMNPSMVTSKRLVIHPTDFAALNKHLSPEYLVEFKLAPGTNPKVVQDAYSAAGLPSQGPAVTSSIFRLMNAMSTMIIAASALMVAMLLILVAILALRFAFLAAIEKDLPEIGALKAIGAPTRHLKGLYLAKYALLAVVGSLVGLVLSIPLTIGSSRAALLYLGRSGNPVMLWTVPVLGAVFTALLVVAYCWMLLRRIDKLSATEALRGAPARR